MCGIVVNTCELEISASTYPEEVSEVRWAPSEAIVNLARQIAANKASTLLSHGMGPNHFFFFHRLNPTVVSLYKKPDDRQLLL
jgi:hypothetical protein